MAKIPCFTSFDFEHDDDLRTMLIGQSKNPDSPFDIADWSVKEELSGDWEAQVRTRITRCKQVPVICGLYTNTAGGVSTEIRIARDLGVPYFLLSGRNEGTVKKPTAALESDKLYNWTWENLKNLIAGQR